MGGIAIGIIAIIKIIKSFKAKNVKAKEVLLGGVTSFVLFGLVVGIYLMEGRAWVLGSPLRIDSVWPEIPKIKNYS